MRGGGGGGWCGGMGRSSLSFKWGERGRERSASNAAGTAEGGSWE